MGERFTDHVFISYAHRDNQAIPNQKGWVTQFDEALRTYLGQRLGVDPVIWRDSENLQGNSVLTPAIQEGLASSAVFITVLSPSYVNSQWCRQELEGFCRHAQKSGGLLVDNQSRVLKIVKLPPESLDILPDPLRDVLDYRFFRELDDGDYCLELDPGLGEEDRKLFVQRIARVAADAARLIKQLQATAPDQASDSATGATPQGLKPQNSQEAVVQVFMADCAPDVREEKERLLADLKLSGYKVVPECTLPVDSEADYCAAAKELLNACHISIHLIGNRYGTVPDAEGPSQKSVVELQNTIAAELSTKVGLRRVIWLPINTRTQDDRQLNFIKRLQEDSTLQAGADLVSGDFEELRSTVHRLTKARQEALAATAKEEVAEPNLERPMGYLVCTEADLKMTLPLRKWMKQQGIEVELPLFQGDAQMLRKANQDLICRCSGILLFFGAGEEAWFRAVSSDHRKIRTYRVGLPQIPRYIYLAEPDNLVKQDLVDIEEADLIDGRRGFDPDLLLPFVEALNASGDRHA